VAVAPDLDVELLRERVDATDADAMQAAGDLVGGGVEFAAGMELGEHHLHGRHHLAVGEKHHVHRDAAAVIDHGDRVVDVDDDLDFFAVAGQRLVHRVVHHLVDQVVQAHLAGGADVHGGTQAHGLQAFKDLDVLAGIAAVIFGERCGVQGISRHRIPFARPSLRFPQGARCPGAVPGRESGSNRLKD
jgi:hypothetical protein